LLLATLAVAACDDDDDITDPGGAIALSVSRPDLDIAAGSSDTLTATITRTSFSGNVALTIEGAPTGVTAALETPTLSATQSSSVINVTVVAAVAPGEYPLTVKATGNGVAERQATITLNVLAAVESGFSLSASGDTARITQGGTTTTLVTLTRTGGFAGDVAITTDSLPAGVTAAIGTPTLSGDTTTVTLTASASAATGTFRFFITGTADTVVRTDTIPIIISASAVIGAARTAAPRVLLADAGGRVAGAPIQRRPTKALLQPRSTSLLD
jgi:uncharacterized membrane protein